VGRINDNTMNIRWLTDERAAAFRLSPQGIERKVVHLELNLGLRRIEVLRLGLGIGDIETGRMGENEIMILGKGEKWRSINWDPDTAAILSDWLERIRICQVDLHIASHEWSWA